MHQGLVYNRTADEQLVKLVPLLGAVNKTADKMTWGSFNDVKSISK